MNDIDYGRLPPHIRHGVQEYIEHGNIPGHFLQAVISNDLCQSLSRADEINRGQIFNIVSFFYNEAPGECWGSAEKIQAWAKHGGLDRT